MNIKPTLDHIVSVFSGEDGGIAFVKFRFLLENLEKKANEGDVPSIGILKIVMQFAKLVEIAEQQK